MMKHEFEKLVGMEIDPVCYEKIEYVYMTCNFFDDVSGKQQIADFYKRYDMNGIEKMYREMKMKIEAFRKLESLEEAYKYVCEENKQLRRALERIKEHVRLNLLDCGM
jgi:hypothetical protein